jgi:hypothetical protein
MKKWLALSEVEAAGIAPAAPIYEVVLTFAFVEPLVPDRFWVTLTPAARGASCTLRSDDTALVWRV